MSLRKSLIYLEESQLRELKRRARAQGTSMASEVREAVARYLAAPKSSRLEGFVGCGEGPSSSDTSTRADEILKDLLG